MTSSLLKSPGICGRALRRWVSRALLTVTYIGGITHGPHQALRRSRRNDHAAALVRDADGTVRDLVKVNVLLTRASDVAPMNALHASAFGPQPYPARTTCVVQALPNHAMLIEIECVASLAGK